MKTGIVRRIDDLGRVVIPKEIRQSLRFKEGDPLEISIDGNKVVLERYNCVFDYEKEVDSLIEIIKEYDDVLSVEEIKRVTSKLKKLCNVLSEKAAGEDK